MFIPQRSTLCTLMTQYIFTIHVDQHFMPAVCQCPHMYLLFSLLYCAVIRLSQTAHLSLWIGTVVCVTDESFPLSRDSPGRCKFLRIQALAIMRSTLMRYGPPPLD